MLTTCSRCRRGGGRKVDENCVLIDGYCSLIVATIVRKDEVEAYKIKASMRIGN